MAKRGSTRGKKTEPAPTPKRGRPPRQRALPGHEGVRSEKLDSLCESIGDERETMNKARTETQALIAAALEIMTKKGISVYRNATIELARIPGADKLRVRVTKEEGDADDGDAEDDEIGSVTDMTGETLRAGVQAEH